MGAVNYMANRISCRLQREVNLSSGGEQSKILLTIHGIVRVQEPPGKACWACLWSLGKIHPRVGRIYGEDPLAALLNCVRFLIMVLKNEESLGHRIWWLQEGDCGGLCELV
jgi:hypothetical protein